MEEHSGTGKEHFHTYNKRSNSVGEYLYCNTFPRIPQIDESIIKSKQQKLLADIEQYPFDPSLSKSKTKYRCHSSARISLHTVYSMESCVRFIRKRRHLLSTNVKILLEESTQLLHTCEDKSKVTLKFDLSYKHVYIHELILIILTYEATPVIKLKENLCSAIFKKTINLERQVDMDPSFCDASPSRIGNFSPISFSSMSTPSPEKDQHYTYKFDELDAKSKKFVKQFKTILGKFRYLLAYLGFYIQCYHATENIGDKGKLFKARSIADYYIHKTYENKGMRIDTGRVFGNQINLFSKDLVQEDVNILLERILNMEENEEPGVLESKDAALNKYFRNKMEKWAQAKMENINVTCRICSKQINAQKFDRHADLCNQKLQTESKIDQISEKLGELANSISKYQRMANVELMIERSALAKKKIQADSTLANLAKLQQMRENTMKEQMRDPKRNTLSILPNDIEEAPDFEESTPMVRNAVPLNFSDPFNLNPSFENQLSLKNCKTEPPSRLLQHILEEANDHEETTPENKPAEVTENFTKSTADLLDELDAELRRRPRGFNKPGFNKPTTKLLEVPEEEIQPRPTSHSISKPPEKFTDFVTDSLTEKSSDTSFRDDSSTHSKDSFLKIEKRTTEPPQQIKKQATKKFYRQQSWDPWNNSEASENADSFKMGGDAPVTNNEDKLRQQDSLHSLPDLDGLSKKGAFNLEESSKKLDEFLSSRRNKKGHTLVHGEKRKLASETKQRLHKIKKINALMNGYITLTNNLNMIQEADHHSKEMTLLIDEAKKTIKHNYSHNKDEKFRSISWALLENINKKQEYLRLIHQYQKELDSLESLFPRFHEGMRKKSRVQELQSQLDSPDTPDSITSSKKKGKKNYRAKSAQKFNNSIRMEIFARNMRKMSYILRKQDPTQIEEKRNTLLQKPNLQKMLGHDYKRSSKPQDSKTRYSQAGVTSPIDKSNIRRIRTTTIDLTPHRNPPKLSKYAMKPQGTRDDEFVKIDEPKDDPIKKSITNLPHTPSSNSENESSQSTSSDEEERYKDDDESFEDILDDHALDENINKQDHDVNDTAYFSDDASTIKVFREKPSELANLIGINDFEFIKFISKGAYGKVYLVKRKATGDFFAMKLIPFSDRMNRNSIDSLKNEKKVFEVLRGDWVVKAPFTFVHENYLCIVMELMVGGDFAHIMQEFVCMDQVSARFYIAEVILALDSLHDLKIIHRDLKPDNLLLSKDGHLKLTDFGLSEVGAKKNSKQRTATNLNPDLGKYIFQGRRDFRRGSTLLLSSDTQNKLAKLLKGESSDSVGEESKETSTTTPSKHDSIKNESRKGGTQTANRIVGTPDYIAPEVLNGENYDDPCIDWWSVGVLLFEFLTGIPPFNADTVDEIFDNIKNRRIPWDQITIGYEDDSVTPEAKDLIDNLLTLDRKKRLGARGVHEIQQHEFFTGFDWKSMNKQTPPLVPENKFSFEQKQEVINPFDALGASTTKINTKELTFNRIDILHAENKKILEETKQKAKLEPSVQEGILQRRWSVYDEESLKKK